MSEGERWIVMRDWPIKDLTRVASEQSFGQGEEMARSLLRRALVTRRINQTCGEAA